MADDACGSAARIRMMNPLKAFLEEKEKQAGFLGDFGRSLQGALSPGALGHYTAPAIASAGVAAAGLGLKAGYDLLKEKLTRQRDYKIMVSANPSLRQHDAKQVQMVYSSLRRLSPSMARDPLLAGSFVRKTIELSPESGLSIDVMTAKTIAETQKNIQQAKSSRTSVYEAMLGGAGKQMPGVQVSYGVKGPQVSGPQGMAESAAKGMGLPTTMPGPEGPRFEASARGLNVQGSREAAESAMGEFGWSPSGLQTGGASRFKTTRKPRR
jgi:hypothetical protein